MRFHCLAFACAALGLLAIACSDASTTYGSPEGLKGTMLPTPMGTTTANPPPPGMDSGMTPPPQQDSGMTMPVVDSGGPPPPGDTGAGGPCAVTWSGKIYPALTTTWGCTSSGACHGTGSLTAPLMTGTATTVYNTFAAFTPQLGSPGGLNYIVPGSTDPTKSSFLCSVDQTGTCGNLMPLGLTPLTAAELGNITTWIACGTPND